MTKHLTWTEFNLMRRLALGEITDGYDRAALWNLRDHGFAAKDGIFGPYRLTDKGLDALVSQMSKSERSVSC